MPYAFHRTSRRHSFTLMVGRISCFIMWRFITLLIFAFWAVMVTLLIRATYYPEESRFAQLPPRAVLKMFLDQANSSNTLHLYHEGVKVGHVFLSAHHPSDRLDSDDYSLLISGLLEKGAVKDLDGALSWRVGMLLLGAERWGGASGQVRLHDSATVFDFNWPQSAQLPAFTLRKGTEIVADDKLLQMLIPETVPDAGGDQLINVRAREGVMMLAGQNRRGYVLELKFMEYHVKAFFTEAGELAFAELPGGYRALEPVVHGLVPDETSQE